MSHIIPVDSSTGEYSMWTQIHECLAYNPTDEYLQFVCRTFGTGAYLDVWQADRIFSFFITDPYLAWGSPRYPNSIASLNGQGPHISAPVLQQGTWGLMMGQYESGGWFSSFWDSPVDVGTGDLDVHKCIGKQLPNGNLLFIGVASDGYNPWLTWSTYTPDLSTRLAGGIVAPETSYYWGFDINGGIAYLFYHDKNLNIYYKTTTDGINWSPAQIYDMNWPEPFDSNRIYWKQMAVTENGNPLLVFDNINGADTTYPYEGKIYVSIAPGQPCIEVGITAAGAENFYPTIATGGNYIVVLFGKPRSGNGQYTFWDIYYNYSMDNGLTWHTPICLTSDITDHNNCLWQIAKRLDVTEYGQLFFAFGSSITNPMLDLYYNIIGGGTPTPTRWYVGRNPVVSITENRNLLPADFSLKVFPNPTTKSALIRFGLYQDEPVEIEIADALGGIVKSLLKTNLKKGIHLLHVDLTTKELSGSAVYFVILKRSDKIIKTKIIKIK